jgi:hypothetical protein
VKVAYFVHNLDDPAVARRVRMLVAGGCEHLVLLGFRRREAPVETVAGIPAIDLGRTVDGGFLNRVRGVIRAAAALGTLHDRLAGTTVFIGRNLEGLQLAARARRRFGPGGRLIYECLDIHRLMLRGPAAPVMRGLERRLLARSDLLIVSSPAFATDYFRPVHRRLPPILVIENKVLDDEAAPPPDQAEARRPPGPPWRIGWYGSLRDRESLHLLKRVAERLAGRVKIDIAGVPSRRELPDFDAVVASTPNLAFHGAYDRARDLPRLYGDAHFTWAIERYEKGGNGEWQLVNRLYEGGLFASVMIAEANVEMGRWLTKRGSGVPLDEPVEDRIVAFFESLDAATYEKLEAAARAVPRSTFVADLAECCAVVATLIG